MTNALKLAFSLSLSLSLGAAGCGHQGGPADGGAGAGHDSGVGGGGGEGAGGGGSGDDGGSDDGGEPGDGGVTPASAPVVVQLFDWPFDAITAELPLLASFGYTHVHVSPPQLSNPSPQWWARYQPVDYRVIDGPLGDEASFAAMVTAARAHGIAIVVDVVFNHMANLGAGYDLTYPPDAATRQTMYGQSYPQLTTNLFTADDFHSAFCTTDWTNPQQVRDGRLCSGSGDTGLPDLIQLDSDGDASTVRADVLAAQSAFLQHLLALGVGGFRFDAIKSMEPGYFPALIGGLPSSLLMFGESPVGNDQADWDDYVTPYLSLGLPLKLYDFALQAKMIGAFGLGGQLGDLLGVGPSDYTALPLDASVAFVLNHDIPQDPEPGLFMGSCSNTSAYGDPVNERLAYVFVLGRAGGVPYVYSDRGLAGGNGDGTVSDAYADAHRRCDLGRMVRFHALTAGLAQTTLVAAANQIAWQRGQDAWVAINKAGDAWTGGAGSSSLRDGRYVDLLSDAELTVAGGVVPSFTVGARDAVMFVHDTLYTAAQAAQVAALACTSAPLADCTH